MIRVQKNFPLPNKPIIKYYLCEALLRNLTIEFRKITQDSPNTVASEDVPKQQILNITIT